MKKSARQASGNGHLRVWIRRCHRWLGLAAMLFLLLLTATGVALNHSSDWQLDRRYIAWSWLLDAYGIKAPAPGPGYSQDGHRAVQLGGLVFFDAREIPRQVDLLTGLVVLEQQAVLGSETELLLITLDGELVDSVDLAGSLQGPIEKLGRSGGRLVVDDGMELLLADAEVANFEPWSAPEPLRVSWSAASPASAEELAPLQDIYRGRGLSAERLLTDVHNGRIVGRIGPALLDVLGGGLLLLALSGVAVWAMGRGRDPGARRHRGRDGKAGRGDWI